MSLRLVKVCDSICACIMGLLMQIRNRAVEVLCECMPVLGRLSARFAVLWARSEHSHQRDMGRPCVGRRSQGPA